MTPAQRKALLERVARGSDQAACDLEALADTYARLGEVQATEALRSTAEDIRDTGVAAAAVAGRISAPSYCVRTADGPCPDGEHLLGTGATCMVCGGSAAQSL